MILILIIMIMIILTMMLPKKTNKLLITAQPKENHILTHFGARAPRLPGRTKSENLFPRIRQQFPRTRKQFPRTRQHAPSPFQACASQQTNRQKADQSLSSRDAFLLENLHSWKRANLCRICVEFTRTKRNLIQFNSIQLLYPMKRSTATN